MFEAVVNAGGPTARGPAATAAAKKLDRNKQRLSAAASAAELRAGAQKAASRGVPMTAAQRKLAKNKSLGGGMRASLGARCCLSRRGGRCVPMQCPCPSAAAAHQTSPGPTPPRPTCRRGADGQRGHGGRRR